MVGNAITDFRTATAMNVSSHHRKNGRSDSIRLNPYDKWYAVALPNVITAIHSRIENMPANFTLRGIAGALSQA